MAIEMRKRNWQLFATALIMAATPGSAQACGICVTAMADSILPPIGLWVHITRTPAQYIAQWGLEGPGRQRFEELRAAEPRSLDAYRHIVAHADGVAASAAAERLGEVGDPGRDIPLLQEAVSRLGRHGPFTSRIRAGLERLEARERTSSRSAPASGSQTVP